MATWSAFIAKTRPASWHSAPARDFRCSTAAQPSRAITLCKYCRQNFWTGLSRGGDGAFSWVDGSPFDFEFWLTGEPNSIEEECVEADYQTAEWNDAICQETKGWVCMTDKSKK